MIDYGLVTLFAFQLAMVMAVFFVGMYLVRQIGELKDLKGSIRDVTPRLEAFRTEVDKSISALAGRQSEVEASPKRMQARIDDLADDCAKVQRQLEGNDSRVLSLQGRVSALIGQVKKGLAGDDQGDDQEKGPASKDEGIVPDGMGIPLVPEHRPPNQVIPPGFGKPARRAG